MGYEFQATAVDYLPLPVLRNRVEEALAKLAEVLGKREDELWEIAVNATEFPRVFEVAGEEGSTLWALVEQLRDVEASQVMQLVNKKP